MPCSDLYSLAATSVVLLTGKQPDQLYDSYQGKWSWNQIEASPQLKRVLKKMLAERPCDRFQSVDQVRQVLSSEDKSVVSNFTSFISRCRTLILAPGDRDRFARTHRSDLNSALFQATSSMRRIPQRITRLLTNHNLNRVKPWQWGIFTAAIIIIPGLISFALINYQITQTVALDFKDDVDDADAPQVSVSTSQKELDLQRQIHQKIESLELDNSAFYKQVDLIFNEQYPELAGKQLTKSSDHQQYREVWYRIARSLLTKQERKR
jgi:serine/threonine protein kinase